VIVSDCGRQTESSAFFTAQQRARVRCGPTHSVHCALQQPRPLELHPTLSQTVSKRKGALHACCYRVFNLGVVSDRSTAAELGVDRGSCVLSVGPTDVYIQMWLVMIGGRREFCGQRARSSSSAAAARSNRPPQEPTPHYPIPARPCTTPSLPHARGMASAVCKPFSAPCPAAAAPQQGSRRRPHTLPAPCALPQLPRFDQLLPPWLTKPPGSRSNPFQADRDELLSIVARGSAASSSSQQRASELVAALLGSALPFKESLLDGGPWVVVYTEGALQLWRASWQTGKLLSRNAENEASQAFEPSDRSAFNKAEFWGGGVFVTAEGTYTPLVSLCAVVELDECFLVAAAPACLRQQQLFLTTTVTPSPNPPSPQPPPQKKT